MIVDFTRTIELVNQIKTLTNKAASLDFEYFYYESGRLDIAYKFWLQGHKNGSMSFKKLESLNKYIELLIEEHEVNHE